MKKILFILMCCLCLCGCEKDIKKQTTVCIREYTHLNMTSVEIYNSQNNTITSASLGMLYSFDTSLEALKEYKKLLDTYEDKSLISFDEKNVYEWGLKDAEMTGDLANKINELESNNYICETRNVE